MNIDISNAYCGPGPLPGPRLSQGRITSNRLASCSGALEVEGIDHISDHLQRLLKYLGLWSRRAGYPLSSTVLAGLHEAQRARHSCFRGPCPKLMRAIETPHLVSTHVDSSSISPCPSVLWLGKAMSVVILWSQVLMARCKSPWFHMVPVLML